MAVDSGEDAAGEGEPGEDEAAGEEGDPRPGSRPDTAVAPAGILPGDLILVPAPDPGSPVAQAIPLDYGVAIRTASGFVAVIPDDSAEPRWTSAADAVLLGVADGDLVVLDRAGAISVTRIGDGALLSSVPTGRSPTSGTGPAVAAMLPSGTLAWVSGSEVIGFTPRAAEPAFELALPQGMEPLAAVSLPRSEPAGSESRRDLVLFSLGDSGVAALATDAGGETSLAWTTGEPGTVLAPALGDPGRDRVLAAGHDGTLWALEMDDGRRRWRWRLGEGFDHPPLLSGERLYAATRANTLYAFDRGGGTERWRTALPGRAAGSPLRVAGAIVIATRDGLLLEVNPVTGLFIGRYRALDAEITGVVASRPDEPSERGWRARRLYLGLRDGRLAILAPRTGANRVSNPSPGESPAP